MTPEDDKHITLRDILGTINSQFDRLDSRLESLQQSSNDMLRTIGGHESRIRGLEAGGRRHTRKDDPPAVVGDNEPITYKDLKRGVMLAAAVFGIAAGMAAAYVIYVIDAVNK